MKFALFGVALACLILGSSAEFETKDGVYIITNENYKEAIETFPPSLYVFSATWCPPCKQLAPELVRAVKILADQKINARIGKIDVDDEWELADEHNIRLIPTIKLYVNGEFIEYDVNADRSAESLVNFIISKTSGNESQVQFLRTSPAKTVDNKQCLVKNILKLNHLNK